MSQIQTFKKIIVEDYKQEDRALVTKLAGSINIFAEDVQYALNKNIDISNNLNLNQTAITVIVDALGVPTNTTVVKSGLASPTSGISVIRAVNVTRPSTFPTGAPFITYTDSNSIVTIRNITGLTSVDKWVLTIILYP